MNNEKKLHIVTVPIIVITATFYAGCQSPTQKEADKENVQDAREQLKETKQALNPEYPAFKKDAEEKIASNNVRIADITAKLSDSGKAPLDGARRHRIEDLKKRNAELRSRLYGYETERSDWVAFKKGFNDDMDKLHKGFTDFGNDLK